MKNNELKIIFKAYPLPKEEYEKRVDEVGDILYELYCQYQLKESVHKSLNEKHDPSRFALRMTEKEISS